VVAIHEWIVEITYATETSPPGSGWVFVFGALTPGASSKPLDISVQPNTIIALCPFQFRHEVNSYR
jgi:hypothetical protein